MVKDSIGNEIETGDTIAWFGKRGLRAGQVERIVITQHRYRSSPTVRVAIRVRYGLANVSRFVKVVPPPVTH